MSEDPVPTVSADDYLGKLLDGRYRIESVLGQGGMGMVFRGMQTSMNRPVAIKTLHPQLAMAPTFFERFKREAELASRLHHPNIISVIDFGRTTDNLCYYVMELLEGESLKQLVKRSGPMSIRRATAVMEQVCLGLSHSHKQGVVHRDLKPHNIMINVVDGAEYVKVLDFGLVKAMEQEDEEQLTSTGQVLGTPQYMPPEQAGGEPVDHRSDLYSLAGVLYYCLTGSSPYGANTVRKALTAALTKPVPPVATHRKGAPVPRQMDEVLRKGLAKEKEDRYQSCEEFVADMLAACEGLTDAELDALPEGIAKDSSREGSGSEASPKSKSRGSQFDKKGASRSGASRPLPKASGSSPSVKLSPELDRERGGSTSMARREREKQTAPEGRPLTPADLAEPPPPTETRRAVPKLVLVAVPVVLALIAAGVWLGTRTPDAQPVKVTELIPPTQAPKPPEVVKPVDQKLDELANAVVVSFKTNPAGANVLESGVVVGKTPLDRTWPKNEVREVTFQLAGFEPITRNYKLENDGSFEVVLEPVRKALPVQKSNKKKDDGIQAFE